MHTKVYYPHSCLAVCVNADDGINVLAGPLKCPTGYTTGYNSQLYTRLQSVNTVSVANSESSSLMIWHWAYFYQTTHTRLTALCPGLPRWAGTREVKPIWILLNQRDGEWQWHQLGHMQVCTSLQTDNHASTPPLRFLQAGCPSCRPTNQSTEGTISTRPLDKYSFSHCIIAICSNKCWNFFGVAHVSKIYRTERMWKVAVKTKVVMAVNSRL